MELKKDDENYPEIAVIAIAGPIKNGEGIVTNIHWWKINV